MYGIMPQVGYMAWTTFRSTSDSCTEACQRATLTQQCGLSLGVRYYLDMMSKNNLFPSVGVSYEMNSITIGDADAVDGSDIRVGAGLTQAMGGAQGGFFTLMLDYTMQAMGEGDTEMKSAGIDVNVGFGMYFRLG